MERRPPRLGLLGGSFDPVHEGHLHAARAARDGFDLEGVVFVPAARPPHKPGRVLAPAHHRQAMLELALAREPSFTIDPRELSRPGPSFTIDTVRELEQQAGGPDAVDLYLVLGSDNLKGLASWRAVGDLLARVQPIVIQRGADAALLMEELRGELDAELVERLERGLLELPPMEVAATELRWRLARGEDPGPLLGAGVFDYVRAHGLYAEAR